MNYILHYNIAAIGIMLLTIYILVTRKDVKRADNRILLLLCILHLFSVVVEIIAVRVQSDIPRWGLGAASFFNHVFLLVHTQMTLVLIIYIVTLLGVGKKLSLWLKGILVLPSAIVLFVLVLNPFLGWYFYYNEQNIYSYGPMTPVILAGPVSQMLMLIWLIAKYRKALPNRMFSAIILFLALSAGALAIQFGHKEWLIELYAQSLGLLGAMLALENKDDVRTLVSMMEELETEKRGAEEARAQADAANRSKSDFLSNMSHEIRTPINAVLGMNEMILRESGDERITTYARNVESAGKNLLSIINDILDFSKIEAGKMEIVEAPYQLSSVLNDISNMVVFRARAKNLSFHVVVDETIPDHLCGDAVRVRQVITNILTNAVKYTMEGSVTLSVKAEREQNNRDSLTLVIDVKDTGIGIREEDIGKLFTKFSRVDLNQTNTIEGTGLGLAITENLLLMMQGNIQVQSVYGEGSAFTIRIPQRIVSEEAIGDFHQRFEDGLKTMKSYRESFRAPEARILVVDDTELNLVVIEGLLRKTEVQLDKASGGEEALSLCRDVAYDLILLDQRMPHMSGTEVLEHIRAQEKGRNRETPVICLTADAVQGARERYLEEGFSHYLSKPVESAALESALMEFLPADKIILMATGEQTGDENENQPAASDVIQDVPETASVGENDPLRMLYGDVISLDYDEAMKHSQSEELLERTLNVFYETLPEKTDEIETLLEQEDYENYTIKVHAMKSGLRLIGGVALSELAEALEAKGNAVRAEEDVTDEAVRFIRENTPELVSSLRTLEASLRPFLQKEKGNGKDLPELPRETLEELYEAIPEFAGVYDQDAILRLIQQTDGYRIPEPDRKKLEQIRKYAKEGDWNGLRGETGG